MKKERKGNQFLKGAYYEGGNTAFRKFVAKQLKYPKEAKENKIEGIVHLKISINHKGKVIGAKVVKGIGAGCDEEALRIIKLAEYEVPKGPRGVRVKHNKNVRIQFKIKEPKQVKKIEPQQEPENLSINYEIVPQKSKKNKKPGENFGYTISY